jgi:UDP-N-acetylmuramoylalanine--D-glutamate ligase
MKFAAFEGRRVAIWGFGREGRAAREALRRHLPGQPLTLFCNDREAAHVRAVDGIDVCTRAPDADDLAAFDIVIKSPGISIYKPEILAAKARGTTFTSGTALWFGEHPDARVIGITGTKGKSTTAAMAAHMARAAGLRTALAGNIGVPLLELDEQKADLWVIELSSFQTGEAGPLEVGVVTSLYEEHLDWHGTRERYFADKLKLAEVARTLVVNAAQPELLARTAAHPHRVLFGGDGGWTVHEGDLYHDQCVVDPSFVAVQHVPGFHNALNACAAIAAIDAAGVINWSMGTAGKQGSCDGSDEQVTMDDVVFSLVDFEPLPHRLQRLGQRDGFEWVNDSISTNPQAALAALDALAGRPLTMILGGYDRGVDWFAFAVAAATRGLLRIIVQGANGPCIAAALRAAGAAGVVHEAVDLREAVAMARELSHARDTILLSPGAPSFDQFRAYTERGACFAKLAGFDASCVAEIEGLGIA